VSLVLTLRLGLVSSPLVDGSVSSLLIKTALTFLADLLAAAQNMSQEKRGSAADVHHARCAGTAFALAPCDAPEPVFVVDGSVSLVLTLRLGLVSSPLVDGSVSSLLIKTALTFLADLLAAAKHVTRKAWKRS